MVTLDQPVAADHMYYRDPAGSSWSMEVAGGVAPYGVQLDSGSSVLVHQDEHWLVRDLALQPPGPRIAADGTRNVARIEKRKVEGALQMTDHNTRKVRKVALDDSDDDEEVELRAAAREEEPTVAAVVGTGEEEERCGDADCHDPQCGKSHRSPVREVQVLDG